MCLYINFFLEECFVSVYELIYELMNTITSLSVENSISSVVFPCLELPSFHPPSKSRKLLFFVWENWKLPLNALFNHYILYRNIRLPSFASPIMSVTWRFEITPKNTFNFYFYFTVFLFYS